MALPAEQILDADQLKEITGYQRDGDLMRFLREECGIICFPGRKGPWTTMELVTLAGKVKMGIAKNEGEKEQWL